MLHCRVGRHLCTGCTVCSDHMDVKEQRCRQKNIAVTKELIVMKHVLLVCFIRVLNIDKRLLFCFKNMILFIKFIFNKMNLIRRRINNKMNNVRKITIKQQ